MCRWQRLEFLLTEPERTWLGKHRLPVLSTEIRCTKSVPTSHTKKFLGMFLRKRANLLFLASRTKTGKHKFCRKKLRASVMSVGTAVVRKRGFLAEWFHFAPMTKKGKNKKHRHFDISTSSHGFLREQRCTNSTLLSRFGRPTEHSQAQRQNREL